MKNKKNRRRFSLNPDTIRALTAGEVAIVATGCPTGSWPTVGGTIGANPDGAGAGTC